MNIFATTSCPVESAIALDDQRLVKMVLETAQLLSITLRKEQGDDWAGERGLYKMTHPNHPCAVWARADERHLAWLAHHGAALSSEYTRRYARLHRSNQVLVVALEHCAPTFALKPRYEELVFQNSARNKALNLDFTHLPAHEAYRAYLSARWALQKKEPRWTEAQPPAWRS